MPKNPNIPYEENAKYVSLPSSSAEHSLVTPLIKIEQYREVEERFKKLPPQAKELLVQIARISSKFSAEAEEAKILKSCGLSSGSLRVVGSSSIKGTSPVMDELTRAGFLGLTTNLALSADTKTIIRDIAGGKHGFTTPTYNVSGKVVVSDCFDAAGNLAKNVAKIYGVPQARDEAILARASGIRKELIGTVRPPPPTAATAKPATMRM